MGPFRNAFGILNLRSPLWLPRGFSGKLTKKKPSLAAEVIARCLDECFFGPIANVQFGTLNYWSQKKFSTLSFVLNQHVLHQTGWISTLGWGPKVRLLLRPMRWLGIYVNEAMSITNRYFTSLFSMRS
jgi:hypothetical protein